MLHSARPAASLSVLKTNSRPAIASLRRTPNERQMSELKSIHSITVLAAHISIMSIGEEREEDIHHLDLGCREKSYIPRSEKSKGLRHYVTIVTVT